MTDKAAIDGDYCDFRLVRTRKVCQVVVEFPIERAGEVTQALGWPRPDGTTRCAVALIEIPSRQDTRGITERGEGRNGASPEASSPLAKSLEGAATREDADGPRSGEGLSAATRTPSAKPPRKLTDMPPSSRAALLCKDPEFWSYLSAVAMDGLNRSELSATAELKTRCGVSSRAEIVEGSRAAAELSRIIGNYNAWKQAKGLGQI